MNPKTLNTQNTINTHHEQESNDGIDVQDSMAFLLKQPKFWKFISKFSEVFGHSRDFEVFEIIPSK